MLADSTKDVEHRKQDKFFVPLYEPIQKRAFSIFLYQFCPNFPSTTILILYSAFVVLASCQNWVAGCNWRTGLLIFITASFKWFSISILLSDSKELKLFISPWEVAQYLEFRLSNSAPLTQFRCLEVFNSQPSMLCQFMSLLIFASIILEKCSWIRDCDDRIAWVVT